MKSSILTLIAFVAYAAAANEKKVICYFSSWSVYRGGNGQIAIPEINAKLCTHLIYMFVGLDKNDDVKILDPWADLPAGKDGFNRFNSLRTKNPKLKTLIAIGGWNEGSIAYSKMAADPKRRAAFVNNVVKFVKDYNFNGLDFDWEYPAQRGGKPADKKNYVILLKEMKERFVKERLLLTAAVAAIEPTVNLSYEVAEISKYLDFINVMTYDFHGSWDLKTGITAPLYPAAKEKAEDKFRNVVSVTSCY